MASSVGRVKGHVEVRIVFMSLSQRLITTGVTTGPEVTGSTGFLVMARFQEEVESQRRSSSWSKQVRTLPPMNTLSASSPPTGGAVASPLGACEEAGAEGWCV